MKPHLLILSWRDIKHPKAGDAEIFTHEMLRRVTDDYTITHLSPAFEGGYDVEFLDGITYVRRCTPTTLILYAAFYYWKNTSSIDLVIEQVNIHQFFTPFYVPRTKRVLFIHQFTREIWKINFRQPYAWVGEQTETLRLQLYCHGQALTVSQSTADDLRSIGFSNKQISILPKGLDFTPWKEEMWKQKEPVPTFVYVCRMCAYKGFHDVIQAFVVLKQEFPAAKLWVIGKQNEESIHLQLSPLVPKEIRTDIIHFDLFSAEEKLERMSRATALLFPSKREGWELAISEAAAVGTPSIVYDAPGLRDAVQYGMAGYMAVAQSPGALASEMRSCIQDTEQYDTIRYAAYRFAQTLNWDNTGKHFRNWLQNEVLTAEKTRSIKNNVFPHLRKHT